MNKLFSIVLIIMLSLPVAVQANGNNTTNEIQDLPVVNTIDDDVEHIEDNNVDYKVPIDKKKIINKFLVAMGAVAGSSLLIFFGLTAYNRVRDNLLGDLHAHNGESSLETPENYEDAVKTFLDKTHW